MEHRSLGASGLKVPVLCLGAMTFGEVDEKSFMHKVGCDEKTSFSIMSRAFERGVTFIDTADVYGPDGMSERIVGGWLAETKTRDRVILATKFRFRMGDAANPNGSGASRYRIVRTVEESLRRLKTDRIDLYQIHMQDIETPEEETLRALDDLVRAGKVLYLGASNYAAYRLTDSQWIAKSEHLHRFVSLQMQYSLLVRDLEREHIPVCKQFGLGVLPWSPLASGFLSGKYARNQPPPPGGRLEKWKERFADFDNDRGWRTLATATANAKEKDTTPAAVALGWLLAKPTVTSVLFGARSVEQLEDNLRGADVSSLRPRCRSSTTRAHSRWATPTSSSRTSRSAGNLGRSVPPALSRSAFAGERAILPDDHVRLGSTVLQLRARGLRGRRGIEVEDGALPRPAPRGDADRSGRADPSRRAQTVDVRGEARRPEAGRQRSRADADAPRSYGPRRDAGRGPARGDGASHARLWEPGRYTPHDDDRAQSGAAPRGAREGSRPHHHVVRVGSASCLAPVVHRHAQGGLSEEVIAIPV